MVLDEYAEQIDSGSTDEQQATHINFKNPRHPEASSGQYSEEDMQEWFEAALHVQNSSIDRTALIGDFLSAVQDADEADDNETLMDLFRIIRPEQFGDDE